VFKSWRMGWELNGNYRNEGLQYILGGGVDKTKKAVGLKDGDSVPKKERDIEKKENNI